MYKGKTMKPKLFVIWEELLLTYREVSLYIQYIACANVNRLTKKIIKLFLSLGYNTNTTYVC